MGKKPNRSKYEKNKERRKNNERSEIEGRFGTAKTKFGMEKIGARLIQTTYASINMMFLAMNLLKLSGKVPGNIFFGVFALVMTALIGIKCQLTALFDNHVRTVFPYGANSVRFERLRMTF